MIRALLLFALLVGGQLFGGEAAAHESLPVYLGIVEEAPNSFAVTWRVPATQGVPPTVTPSFPSQCVTAVPATVEAAPGSLVGREVLKCGSGLNDGKITLIGLDRTVLDALVRIAFVDGHETTVVLHPNNPSLSLGGASRIDVNGYFRLGVEHILFGVDHLLFVTGLVLIVRRPWRLAKTITAFTLAHSITLALAALGFVHVPPAPVEATIALSIVFLARELVRAQQGTGERGEGGLTACQPWLVAFAFGLLHGFGFATGLTAMGLPRAEIPQALLLFNLGVEIGQLAFVAIVIGLGRAFRLMEIAWPRPVAALPAFTVGVAGAFWTWQRLAVFFGGSA